MKQTQQSHKTDSKRTDGFGRLILPLLITLLISTILPEQSQAQDRGAILQSAYEYVAEQEWELARQQFDLLVGYNSRDEEGLIGLAICAFHEDDLDEAEYRLSRAADLEPEDARIWYWIGRVDFERRNYEQAWYGLNDSWYLDSLQQDLDYYRGASAYQVGLDSIAVYSLNKFLQEKPNHAYGNYYYGMALIQIGAADRAMKYFDKAIEMDERLPRFHLGKGDAYAEMGELLLASISYRAATRRNPDYGEAWYRLGWAMHELGQERLAYEATSRAVELLPEDPDVLLLHAETSFDRGLFDQAKRVLVDHQEVIGQPNKANFLLGKIYAGMGDYDSAWILFDSVETIDPDQDDVQFEWANTCFKMERFEEAADLYQKCLARNPNEALYAYNLGIVRATQGELNEACALFAQIMKRDEPDLKLEAEKAAAEYCKP